MNRESIFQQLKAYREQNYLKYGIEEIGVFGSVARGQEKSDSDIDIFIKTKTPNPFIIVHVKEELETILNTSVDIVRLHNNMNTQLKQYIDREGISV